MKLITKLLVLVISILLGLYMTIFPNQVPYHLLDNDGLRLLGITKLLNDSFINENPYTVTQSESSMNRDGYCGVRFEKNSLSYYLKNYESSQDATNDGAIITHKNKCGACSSLQDLAVYLYNKDLTRPVRKCGALVFSKDLFIGCIRRLGFSEDCSNIWYYNALNTYHHCFGTCVLSWVKGEKLNKNDGSLNHCIQCDEDKSGPIFKRFAGRTRRNSGIISEIGRGTEEMFYLKHSYLGIDVNF